MWINACTALLLLISSIDWCIGQQVQLRIDHMSSFPISASGIFEIGFVPDTMDSISTSLSDMMIIQISFRNGTIGERAIFDYGFKEMIDQEFKGEYMRIPIWQKNLGTINVSIQFTRRAHENMLDIYTMSPAQRERRERLKDLLNSRKIISERISLLIPPKIDMEIRTQDGRRGELSLDQEGIVKCRAYDGVPDESPEWVNLNEFEVLKTDYNSNNNEIEARIAVKVVYHLKLLRCKAGKTEQTIRINVLHPPSQIAFEPDITNLVENGSSFVCVAVDGYPTPDIRWHFVEGPSDAELYYNITANGKTLHIKKEAPLTTDWTFNCMAKNTLPSSNGEYNRTVKFKVGRPQEGLFGLNLTMGIMIGVAVMGAIILFCVAIVFIVCIVRRSCAGQSESRNHRRNGGPIKPGMEKQTLETELVTLLPPGAPPNHLDMTNNGSGFPPPYQEILDPDIEVTDQQVTSESYPEVTYAELNTSDLPMKERQNLKANNNNDDQVIYSQIIGTMSSPVECNTRGPYLDSDNV